MVTAAQPMYAASSSSVRSSARRRCRTQAPNENSSLMDLSLLACDTLNVSVVQLIAAGRNRILGGKLLEQCVCLLQINGIEALGEEAVDVCQQMPGLILLALLPPQS